MTVEPAEPMPPRFEPSSLPEAIGAVVMATSALEFQLMHVVTGLTQSPLTLICVRGMRGSSLVHMAMRLLKHGVGSTAEDQASGRTDRLGLLSHEDTDHFARLLRNVEGLIDKRDSVAHSMWLTVSDDGTHRGVRMRANPEQSEWTMEGLRELRQQIVNATHDLFVESWNATSMQSGMERMERRGSMDVVG
jgi:hypothetical protein